MVSMARPSGPCLSPNGSAVEGDGAPERLGAVDRLLDAAAPPMSFVVGADQVPRVPTTIRRRLSFGCKAWPPRRG
jgi:hypothetical protein